MFHSVETCTFSKHNEQVMSPLTSKFRSLVLLYAENLASSLTFLLSLVERIDLGHRHK